MIGVIDVGGGMRDIFGAGVLDWCMDQKISFDYAIGVSAGSANLVSYISHQKGRNIHFYTEYAMRKEYMSFSNLIHHGSYLNLDYIYGTLSNEGGEYPIDWDSWEKSDVPIYIAASDARTGKVHFFSRRDIYRNILDPVKASCCIPVINQPYKINGVPYFDGGIADPIPLEKAFEDGCDRVVIILTRPRDYERKEKDTKLLADALKLRYPAMAEAMQKRASLYNRQLAQAKKLEKEGKALILAPWNIEGLKTLTIDVERQMDLYAQGRQEAQKLKDFMAQA